MPLLAYCIAEEGFPVNLAGGNRDHRLISESGLIALVSPHDASATVDQDSVRQAVLDFHSVLREVLQQATIIPFRFPTVVENESAMRDFLREHAEEYKQSLARLRGLVQMEVHLTSVESRGLPRSSGAEYLRDKQAIRHNLTQTALSIRRALEQEICDWRQLDGESGVRCYALVARNSVGIFLEAARNFHISPNLRARVTGPWPATEFIKLKQ